MAGEQIKTLLIPKERNRMDERGDGIQASSNFKCYDGLIILLGAEMRLRLGQTCLEYTKHQAPPASRELDVATHPIIQYSGGGGRDIRRSRFILGDSDLQG